MAGEAKHSLGWGVSLNGRMGCNAEGDSITWCSHMIIILTILNEIGEKILALDS